MSEKKLISTLNRSLSIPNTADLGVLEAGSSCSVAERQLCTPISDHLVFVALQWDL